MVRGRPSRESVFDRFAAGREELARLGGLPTPSEARGIWDDIWHLEAHNSTGIEGNTLVLREVTQLLEEGRAIGAKPLKDYLEVRGYGEAARWVYEQASGSGDFHSTDLVTVTEIRQIHRLAMSLVWEVVPEQTATQAESPGSFRQHDIAPFTRGMTPPAWPDVHPQLTTWVHNVNRFGATVRDGTLSTRAIPGRLAALHASFEAIHPFIDGNGRTGRLLLNLMLVRLGNPPAIIFKRDRDRYLRALDHADQGDAGPLGEQIARSVIDNLHRLIVPNIAGPARMVSLRSLADDELSYPALRQAATRGRLEAYLGSDGTWRTNRKAVDAYKQIRYKRAAT